MRSLACAVSIERDWALKMMSELPTIDGLFFDGIAIRKHQV
jgi:hypothetical protein